jgi:hypothetical protein
MQQRGTRWLLEEIVGSQHYRPFSLDWPFEELTRCSLLNRIAQPHKLIYSLICPHIMLAFKIVHRRGADRTSCDFRRLARMKLSQDAILAMTPAMRRAALKVAVERACRRLMRKDFVMLAIGAHEQAICHRLAVYLEGFADLNVDCEYNRQRIHPKSAPGLGRIKPDILIHKRMDRHFNLLVVEAKARASTSVRDIRKVRALTEIARAFGYALGVYLHVQNKPRRVLRTGKVEMSIAWEGEDEQIKFERRVPGGAVGRNQRAGKTRSESLDSRDILRPCFRPRFRKAEDMRVSDLAASFGDGNRRRRRCCRHDENRPGGGKTLMDAVGRSTSLWNDRAVKAASIRDASY